jgi:hypothetical protein
MKRIKAFQRNRHNGFTKLLKHYLKNKREIMDQLSEDIQKAYESVLINEAGKGQEIILKYLKNLDKKDAEIELSQIAAHPMARGVHFGKLQSAAKALAKKKKIKYDGISRVTFLKEEEELDERKFDLGSGHMGNGISVWNRAKEVHGDYEKIAHIDRNRKIKYYIKNPPKQVKDYVESIAKGKNPNISATQSQKVFNEKTEDFIDDSAVADKVFQDLRIAVNDFVMKTMIPKMKMDVEKIKKKHKLGSSANMFVKNYGTAELSDIYRELLGQQLVSSGNLKKRFMSRN